jgi:hypothetical protein
MTQKIKKQKLATFSKKEKKEIIYDLKRVLFDTSNIEEKLDSLMYRKSKLRIPPIYSVEMVRVISLILLTSATIKYLLS